MCQSLLNENITEKDLVYYCNSQLYHFTTFLLLIMLQVNALSISFDLTRLAEKYGDLFTISLFGQKLVAVNSEELIMELYAKSGEDFVNRPYVSYVSKEGGMTLFLAKVTIS